MLTYQTQQLRQRLEQIKPFYLKINSPAFLNCVRLTATTVQYSNLDVTINAPIPGSGDTDFMVLFPALYEFVRNSNRDEIRVYERNGIIKVYDGRDEIIQDEFFDPEDFPVIPVNDFNIAGFVTADQIQHDFSCYYASDQDDIRFNLHGVCIDAPKRKIIATDGHRLSVRTMQFTLHTKDQHIIPRFIVKGILQLTGTSAVVQFATSESNKEWIAITVGDIALYVKGYDKYPDYEAVLPREGLLKLSFTQPKAALKQFREIKKRTPKKKTVALKGYADGAVRIANGSYRGVLDGCKAVKECFFLVNIEYLVECLRQYEKTQIPVYVWNNNDKAGPWVFNLDGSSDIDLIMPLRGSDEEAWFAATPANETPQTVDTPENETQQETDKPANKPPQKVATPDIPFPKIKQPTTGEKLAGLEWGKKLARALRKRGIRSVAPWGDRLLKVSDKKRELFYLAAAYYVVKSR